MSRPTSVRLSDENADYVDEMDISPSTYINSKLDEDRRTAGLTKKQKLERELAELREERNRKERKAAEIAEQVDELEGQLESYSQNKEKEIEDAIEGLHWITRVHPAARADKQAMHTVLSKTGLRWHIIKDLVDSVDIHFCKVVGQVTERYDEFGVDEPKNHLLYDDEAGIGLTAAEEELVREFLLEQF